MGTNYYLHSKARPLSPFTVEPIHIGKHSAGWAFALRVYPSDDEHSKLPRSFPDWLRLFMRDDVEICTDGNFARTLSPDQMIDIICNRPTDGMRRAAVDGDHCVGHGSTWDTIAREFS